MTAPAIQLSHIAPVTSLSFFSPSESSDRLLLVGEDSFVKVYDVVANQLLRRRRVFTRQRIHGIVVSASGDHVLLWGGNSICIARTRALFADDYQMREVKVSDWIFSAIFQEGAEVQIVAVTAHNDLIEYSEDVGWKKIVEGERCMLYAAQVTILPGQDRVLVAAGTVFGEVLVWSVTRGKTAVLHRTFRGHEGSIFGVCISPGYEHDGVERHFLASCSDDRTVRVWDISELDTLSQAEGDGRKTTGFGVKHVGEGCVALGWGHQARPWGIRFLPPRSGKELEMVTFSEDLTVRFWEFPRTVRWGETAKLQNTKTHLLHSGKNIWSFAFDYERQLLATGGNDSRVTLLDYTGEGTVESAWSIPEIEKTLGFEPEPEPQAELSPRGKQKKMKKKPIDSFKVYEILDADTIVSTTAFGRIVVHDKRSDKWESLGTWDRLKNGSAIDTWKHNGLFVVGARDGHVGIFAVQRQQHWWVSATIGNAPISSVHAAEKDGDSEIFSLLAMSAATTVFAYYSFCLPRDGGSVLEKQSTILFELPEPKFTVTSVHVSHVLGRVFIGCRTGGLAIYSLEKSDRSSPIPPCFYNRALYLENAITGISVPPTSTPSNPCLSTTCRNGTYTLHSLSSTGFLEPLHVSKPTTIQSLEGSFHLATGELCVYGFFGPRFLIYDLSTGFELFSIDCGGAHRSWTFLSSPTGGTFAWTQQSNLHVARFEKSMHRLVQPGIHGREIKVMAAAPCGHLIATGAEDTTVRISEVTDDGLVRRLAVMKRHTSGVYGLHWSRDGAYLFSSAGREELLVWRVRRLRGGGLGVIEEAQCPVINGDSEMRILGLDAVEWGDDGYLVAVAESDSTIKLWHYNTGTKTFQLLLEGRYKESCLMHAKLLRTTASAKPASDGLTLIVAGTDGFLTAYRLPQLPPVLPADAARVLVLPPPIWTHRVHQSTIKSIHFDDRQLAAGSLKIYTGGDDCALGITEVHLDSHGVVETRASRVLPRAHASAVTAVMVLLRQGDADQEGGEQILTAGMDQRIKVWQVSTRGAKKLGEVYSGTADLGDGCLIRSPRRAAAAQRLVVAGVGLEVWEVGSGCAR